MVYCTRRLIKDICSVLRPHNLFLGKVCSTLLRCIFFYGGKARHKGEGEIREISHSG